MSVACPIHATNETKWSECHHRFIVVLGVCGVVSSITIALSHSLVASSIGCAMWWLHGCMVLHCLIECGMSGQTVTRKERKRTVHTGLLVWYVVWWCCVVWTVVSESVGIWVVARCIEMGKGCGERHSHTKSKKMLFSLKPLFPSFSLLFFFFPTHSFPDSLLLCHHPLSITQSTFISSVTHVHIRNEHKPKPTQHSIYFFVFISCSNYLSPHLSSTSHLTQIISLFRLCAIH